MSVTTPKRRRVVVDGSNIATEGRSTPSLAQLDDAIRTFLEEYPGFTTGDVTVIVDATFGHRIDPKEQAAYEQALEHGEMLTPPAGAVGRGDGFILRIAEKSDAIVLSNDSFQEFHAERPWLFDPGRLIGGKPVPGVGWVFTPRTPVRGPRSRSATARSRRGGNDSDAAEIDDPGVGVGVLSMTTAENSNTGRRRAGRAAKAGDSLPAKSTAQAADSKATKATTATTATKVAKSAKTASSGKATTAAGSGKTAKTTKATKTKAATATKAPPSTKTALSAKKAKTAKTANTAKTEKTAKAAKSAKSAKSAKTKKAVPSAAAQKSAPAKRASGAEPRRREAAADASTGSGRAGSSGATGNDPVTFLNFVADHPIGSTMEGTVAAFTSHGAQIDVGAMHCHVPLRGLGDPPPQRARQVLAKGETRRFVLVSLDAARRRAELALAE
jgi:Zc3h12a-like Ribonuclease NYN domain